MKTAQDYYESQRKEGKTIGITSNDYPQYELDFYQTIFRIMEGFASQDKWISASKTPKTNDFEESDNYLCCDKLDNIFITHYNSKLKGWIDLSATDEDKLYTLNGTYKPVFYQPLPLPKAPNTK